MRGPFALLVSLAFLIPTVRPTVAQTTPPITAAAVSHGIRISLTVLQQEYVRHALVRFTVSVENVSHRDRYVQDFQPDYGDHTVRTS